MMLYSNLDPAANWLTIRNEELHSWCSRPCHPFFTPDSGMDLGYNSLTLIDDGKE